MNDWVCPYCGVVAYNGGNKLRHLAKHEPAVRKLIQENFKKTIMLMLASSPIGEKEG